MSLLAMRYVCDDTILVFVYCKRLTTALTQKLTGTKMDLQKKLMRSMQSLFRFIRAAISAIQARAQRSLIVMASDVDKVVRRLQTRFLQRHCRLWQTFVWQRQMRRLSPMHFWNCTAATDKCKSGSPHWMRRWDARILVQPQAHGKKCATFSITVTIILMP